MSPVMSLPFRQLQPSPATASPDVASTLELLLVTLALCTSAVLSLIPSSHDRVQDHEGRPSLFITLFSIFCAMLALFISGLALVLGWTRSISLDALATVVFALIPALLSMPLGNIEYSWLRFRMARFKSLSSTYLTFWYISFDHLCLEIPRHGQVRYEDNGKDIMHIRYFPRRKEILSFWGPDKYAHAAASGVRVNAGSANEEQGRARGRCLEHRSNFMVLENFNKVSEVRWWRSVFSATWIIARPWRVYLNSADDGMQALALLSDIIAIGRLVFKHRLGYVRKQIMRCEKMRKSMRQTAGIVCNAILMEVGLKEWGLIEEKMFEDNYSFPGERCKRYGLLFIVLTIKSDMYGGRRKDEEGSRAPTLERRRYKSLLRCASGSTNAARVSAHSVIQKLRDYSGSRDEFKAIEKREVDRWLVSWGCLQPHDCDETRYGYITWFQRNHRIRHSLRTSL